MSVPARSLQVMSDAAAAPEGADTKELLLRAGERLFARDGINGARVRDINELAGQRNPSALHYHFGSRTGLVQAILLRHETDVDVSVKARLDELEASGHEVGVREIIAAVVGPLVAKLATESGRDWARIIPQFLPALSDNLRKGVMEPITPQSSRILTLLQARMAHLPEPVQRERIVDYAVVLSTLVAERAHELESRPRPLLDAEQFVAHAVDVLVAVVTAPSTVGPPRSRRTTRSNRID